MPEKCFYFCFLRQAFHLLTIFWIYLSYIISWFERFLKISSKEEILLWLLTVCTYSDRWEFIFLYISNMLQDRRRQRNIRKLCTTLPSDVRKSSLIWLLLIPGSFLLVSSIKLVSLCFVWYSMVHVQSINITKHRRLQGSSIHRK